MILVCNKYGKSFKKNEENEYDEHIMNCVKLNCIICKEQFFNHNDFKNHILKDDNHLNFISIKFDINIINDKENSNFGIIPIYQDPNKP